MICDELTEIRVQLQALTTLFWHWKDDNSLPENFGWGIGLLLHRICKDLEKLNETKEKC